MSKKIWLLTALLALFIAVPATAFAADDVAIDEANFPDANFRSYARSYDANGDGSLNEEECSVVKTINLPSRSVVNLKGVEYFANLTTLYCNNNQLTDLDVSQNTTLRYLQCSGNQLTALDLSKNSALKIVYCSGNNLSVLNPSTSLTYLDCSFNQLTALDVSASTALKTLDCSCNFDLADLNVKNCGALQKLNCVGNRLTYLDVSGCTQLAELSCNGNQLTELNLSGCTVLTSLSCNGNQLTELDISDCTTLMDLEIGDNRLINLDVSKHSALVNLNLFNNQITSLDTSGCTELKSLQCGENELTKLDISKNPKLSLLGCSDNRLTDLDITGSPELVNVDCGYNQLTALDVSNNPALSFLNCYDNQLTALDVSQCRELEHLSCSENQLTDLDLSNCGKLMFLVCDKNRLTNLNVTALNELMVLTCFGNQLTALDVSKNSRLKSLDCSGNQLTALNMSENTLSDQLFCTGNRLTHLDLLNGEIKEIGVFIQTSSFEAEKTADGWVTDLSEAVGRENLTKVELAKGQSWQYDPETGIASCTDESVPTKLVYYYNGNNLPEKSMKITLKLVGCEEKTGVVMRFDANRAYADGKISLTTQYANGYATLKNIDGTAMIPLRYIAEVSGFDVAYDEASMKTKVTNCATGEYLLITPGSAVVTKHRASSIWVSQTEAPQPFTVENGVTMGPQRFICEALGLTVHYKWITNAEQYITVTADAITPEESDALIAKAKELGL